MQRKRVYRIGIVVIVFAVLLSPTLYLTLGKVEKGKVIEVVFEYSGMSLIPASSYPKIEYHYKNKSYIITGGENEDYLVGDDVKVIFYKWEPQKAKIYSFWGLMVDSIIQLPFGLLIWWALFKSFPNLFESTISKKEYARMLIQGRLKKRESIIANIPIAAKVIIYTLILATLISLSYGIWTVFQETLSGKISYQIGIGLTVVTIIIFVAIVHKVLKG